MRIVEYVPGELLVFEVASRSRGRHIVHHLSLRLDKAGEILSISCTCEGASYLGKCHHLASLRDMAGAPPKGSISKEVTA